MMTSTNHSGQNLRELARSLRAASCCVDFMPDQGNRCAERHGDGSKAATSTLRCPTRFDAHVSSLHIATGTSDMPCRHF